MDIEVIREVTGDLIEINNDRIVGYEKAREDVYQGDEYYMNQFLELEQHSKNHKEELVKYAIQVGAEIPQGTRTSGKLHRMWMDVKAVFTPNTKESVLESCEFGEDAILKVYKEALDNYKDLPQELISIISSQQASLQKDHDHVKALRDKVKAAS